MPDWIRLPVLLATVAIVALAGFAPAASSELAKWDQDRVTAIAKELAEASDHLYDAFYKINQRPGGAGREMHQLKDTLRLLRSETRHLASELEEGRGHHETLPIYKRLMELVRDARELIQRMYTQQSLLDAIAPAADARRRLAPYYDATALTDPSDAASGAGSQ